MRHRTSSFTVRRTAARDHDVGTIMKKTMRILAAVLIIAAVVFFPHPLAPNRIVAYHWRFHRTVNRIRRADPQQILAACRTMLTSRQHYQRLADINRDDMITFRIPSPGDTLTPDVIRQLGSAEVVMERDRLLLIFFGGFNHLALRAYALGAETGESEGDTELCEGLWLIDD